MLFADGMVLIDEIHDGVNAKLKILECKFSDKTYMVGMEGKLIHHPRETFKYFGTIIQGSVEIDDDVTLY